MNRKGITLTEPTMRTTRWYDNDEVEEALAEARASDKPVLIDLWHPTCLGCAKLFATTYADERVTQFLTASMVCVKYNTTKPNEWFRKLNGQSVHVFHPQIIIADDRLSEGKRFVGYLSPDAFLGQVYIGIGMLHMSRRRFLEALAAFQAPETLNVPESIKAEALYWQGVAAYRVSGTDALIPLWARLVSDFSMSDWSIRANCLDVDIPDAGFDPELVDSVYLKSRPVANH